MEHDTEVNDGTRYQLVQRVTLNNGLQVSRTLGWYDKPLTTGQVNLFARDRAAWSLSTTPEPDWREVYGDFDEDKQPDGDEDEPHIPEPTGVLTMHTDDHRHLVIPATSIMFVELQQLDPQGELVEAEPGWPKDEAGK